MTAIVARAIPVAGQDAGSGYIGKDACRDCHATKFESQSKTAHARALRPAQPTDPGPGSHAQWAFGAGSKAITWVSQTGEETLAEHGLSFYAATKSLALTPGHATSADTVYRTFAPVATALRCFRCHSTGPITLSSTPVKDRVQPSEPGVHCESCHGPGRAHAESGGAARIQNPGRFSATQINVLCGSCHRQASDLDDDRDFSNAWNVRHEPAYLHRAACFRNSNNALSCITCHDPHQPLQKSASSYDARCVSCHPKPAHTAPTASSSCVSCHMPQVSVSANLKFTNHWIGIYSSAAGNLIPSRHAAKVLLPVSATEGADKVILPADPSTLTPVYARALAERERQSGPNSVKVARAASDLGLFLLQIGKFTDAEAPLRRAVSIGEHNSNDALDADREGLALSLAAQERHAEAAGLFRLTAAARDPGVAARSLAKLAEIDPDHADVHYKTAIAAEEKASGTKSSRVALLLHQYALELRARNRGLEAEPLLRRALAIQQAGAAADPRVTIGVLNTLGNLLEGRQQLDEAEKLIRGAVALSEEKFGPESPQLAMSCVYLADVLWSKKNLREAGRLFRRAITIDASLYGPERPETAADIANLGMLMNEAGQSEAGAALLQQALAIYEKTLGSGSEEAKFVKDQLKRPGR
jgi:tetratricopeptide (TPR) repeat protein